MTGTEGDASTETPPKLSAMDAVVAGIVAAPASLLSDETIAYGASLAELDFARFRQKLVTAKLKIGDFVNIAKRRKREQEAEERTTRRAARDVSDDWREGLRKDRVTGFPRASLFNLRMILEHCYGGRLAFDEMAAFPTIDGAPVDDAAVTGIRIDIEGNEDLEFSRAALEEALLYVARQSPYHPVRDYLRALKHDGVKRLDKMAAEYLGAKDLLSAKLVRLTLIAAVARAKQPGCKFDNALVLFGDEGHKKSTFFRVLGCAWFKDSKVDITDRKGMMLMHAGWIYEWPEIDRMLEKKHDSDVKAFVTQQDDSFVPMYGRSVATLLRSNICVGTTNKEKFITSDTGSRRWWVVTVTQRVDAGKLRAERDQIWAEAVELYDAFVREQEKGTADDANPFKWWLNDDEEKGRAERNEEHLTASPDEESVDSWLRGEALRCPVCKGSGAGIGRDLTGKQNECSTCEGNLAIVRGELPKDPDTGRVYVTQGMILDGPLGVPPERRMQNAGRCASVLRRLGWRSGKRIRPGGRDGARVVPYYSPEANPEADARETGVHESAEPAAAEALLGRLVADLRAKEGLSP